MKTMKAIAVVLYNVLAVRMPCSASKFSFGARFLRKIHAGCLWTECECGTIRPFR